ncbi:MAG: BamA/TamA family outer membrane protein [Gemmatimonadota bacterium]|nr:MAG: BamA/TamA family outer membrane protein [Gemmatimonadota bacterium]
MIAERSRGPLVALFILVSAPAALLAQAPVEPELAGLSFEGNEAFSDKELAAAIVNKATSCKTFLFYAPIPLCPLTDWGIAWNRRMLNTKELPLDVLRLRVFYRQRGYRQVSVDTLVEAAGEERLRVTFLIEEGAPTRVRSLAFEGLSGLQDSAAIRDGFPLEEGDPFDVLRLQRGKQQIESRLLNMGYINAAVLDEYFIPQAELEAELMVSVVPGERARIGSVAIEGTEKVDEGLARQFLSFHAGEYYSEQKIRDSQISLLDIAAFRFASIAAEQRTGEDTLVDVTVTVTEANLNAFRTGAGISTTECGVLEGNFAHRNFLGGGRLLTVNGRLGNIGAEGLNGSFPCSDVGDTKVFQQFTWRIGAQLDQPYFISERNRLLGEVFLERESVPNIFVSTSLGGAIGVSRRMNPRLLATFSYRPALTAFDENSTDIYFCASFGICDPDDIAVLTEPRWLSPIVGTWVYDRTDSRLNPTRGYRVVPQAEFAASFTGSEYRYARFALELAAFQKLNPQLTFAFHLRGGIVEPSQSISFGGEDRTSDEIVNPAKRFYGGGANSLRGFRQNLLGPTVLVIDSVTQCGNTALQACADALADTAANEFLQRPKGGNGLIEGSIELRYQLTRQWQLVGFVDWGDVYDDVTTLDGPSATPGAGVRFSSPIGPIRLDLGYNTQGPRLREVVAELGDGSLAQLEDPVVYDPAGYDDPSVFKEFFRRLRVHFAIGQAF